MNNATIDATASAFAALDLSPENARIAEIESDIGQLEAAEKSARERCTAIAREIAEFRGPSGAAVADALLAKHAPSDAAVLGPDLDSLEKERGALSAGAQALALRALNARAELREVKEGAKLKLRPLVQPLVDELTEEATSLGLEIIRIFAALSAISTTTGTGWREVRAVGLMVSGAVDDYGLLLHCRGSVKTPQSIVAALRTLEGKGAALPLSIRTDFTT